MTLAFPYVAQLKNTLPVSNSYLILEFQKPGNFEFIAGQHVTLQLEDQEGIFHRTYSIASPPSSKTRLEFCIQVQSDPRSSILLGQLKKGTDVEMTAARGEFRLQDLNKALVFIAGGSGISPLRSMFLELIATQAKLPQIRLLYGCKEAKAIPFLEELHSLSQKGRSHHSFHPSFFAESLESRPASKSPTSFPIHKGSVTLGFDLDSSLFSKLNDFYLCGPASMLSSIDGMLRDRGIKPEQIYFERYG